MAGFVVCRIATLFFGHDDRAALGAHDDFVFGLFKVAHVDCAAIASSSEQSGLVDQVGQVSAGKTGGSAGKYQGIYVGSQRHLTHMNLQDLFTATDIRQGNHNLAVKAAWAQKRRIEYVGAVGGGNDQHALPRFEAVHFDQQLVECLFAFVVTTAQARSEEHTSELQSLMRISYAVFCLKKKQQHT